MTAMREWKTALAGTGCRQDSAQSKRFENVSIPTFENYSQGVITGSLRRKRNERNSSHVFAKVIKSRRNEKLKGSLRASLEENPAGRRKISKQEKPRYPGFQSVG